MHATSNTTALVPTAAPVYSPGGSLGYYLRLYRRFKRMQHDRATLNEMSDRMLRDIGLTRSEIHAVTRFRGVAERRAWRI